MIIKDFTAEKDQKSIYRSNEDEQRKISVTESSDYQEEEDAVYILSGVVDGFSPVLKTMSQTVHPLLGLTPLKNLTKTEKQSELH